MRHEVFDGNLRTSRVKRRFLSSTKRTSFAKQHVWLADKLLVLQFGVLLLEKTKIGVVCEQMAYVAGIIEFWVEVHEKATKQLLGGKLSNLLASH
jgi:hypothetical protein